MHAMMLAGIGALGICAAVPTLAAEQNAAPNLKPDPSFNAKWDQCEARARLRGTPAGKIGYGDFMAACMGKTQSRAGDGTEPARNT